MSLVLYSALYGRKEPLNTEVFGPFTDVRRVLFTDRDDLDFPGVEIVRLPADGLDPARASRRAKLMPHRYLTEDWSLWLDNKSRLRRDPSEILATLQAQSPKAFFAFRHFRRDCVYQELQTCWENGLDETCHHLNVGLLAYSPLGFGLLSGKYDDGGIHKPVSADGQKGRMALYDSMKAQRWGRPESLDAARQYNALAREHGLTPNQLALAFCYRNRKVASTIIGVTSLAQLDECLDAWSVQLGPELLKAIDAIRWQHRDPAQ